MERPNFRRAQIIEEHLLDYIDQVTVSDRNKEIVKKYAAGKDFGELSEEYGLAYSRVVTIVVNYISKVSKYIKH